MTAPPTSSKTTISRQRLLILAPSCSTTQPQTQPSPFPDLLENLTGSKPTHETTSFSGYTTHEPVRLRTKYYEADVGVWCDELPPPKPSLTADSKLSQISSGEEDGPGLTGRLKDESEPQSLQEWSDQMSSDEAAEVRRAIGGIILVLPFPLSPSGQRDDSNTIADYVPYVQAVGELRVAVEDARYGSDVAAVILLQSISPKKEVIKSASLESVLEKLEDFCLSREGILGWDFVAWDPKTKPVTVENKDSTNSAANVPLNEYGEKTGIDRVREVLEAVDWSADPDNDDDVLLGEVDDRDDVLDVLGTRQFQSGTGAEAEFQREIVELKMAMLDHRDGRQRDLPEDRVHEEERQVDQLQELVAKAMKLREAGSEMSEEQREKFARREVAKMMKDLDMS